MTREFLERWANTCLYLLISIFAFSQQGQTPPPRGRLVDAGGHLIHIFEQGKGGPVVVLESGSGDFSFIWSLVQPEVAKFTKAVSYDRAGFAWSEPGPYPRTDRQITLELHTALQHAGIKGPYVLVGQSFGGFLVRAFARYYPKEVVGMVLVEAMNEDSKIIINDKPMRIREFAVGRIAPAPQSGPSNSMQKNVASNSPQAALDTNIEPPLDKLPDSILKMQVWAQSQLQFRIAADSEMTWSPEDVSRLYLNKGKADYMLGDMPLIVLTRGSGGYNGRADSAQLENERLQLQDELSHLSTNSIHIIDANSGHNIHLEDPPTVINAIKKVVDAARNNTHLKE
jgi:pimeloyl-ACP methyl ester carboxylesterase